MAYSLQIARKQRRRALLQAIRARDEFTPPSEQRCLQKDTQRTEAEARERVRTTLPAIPPSEAYRVSISQRAPIYLPRWLAEHRSDPATKVRFVSHYSATSTHIILRRYHRTLCLCSSITFCGASWILLYLLTAMRRLQMRSNGDFKSWTIVYIRTRPCSSTTLPTT